MKRDDSKALVDAAEEAIGALEALREGEVFAEHVARGTELLEQLHERAAAVVFPSTLSPADAGTLADLQIFTATSPARLGFVEEAIAAHAIAYPALQAAIRSPRVRRMVIGAAQSTAAIRGLTEHVAADADLLAFETAIAEQLVVKDELQPWSQIIAEVLPNLRARFSSAKAKHENAAAAALAALKAEQIETDRILAASRTARRRDLAERLRRQPASTQFAIPITRIGDRDELSAVTLATWIQAGSFGEDFIAALERQLDMLEGVKVGA